MVVDWRFRALSNTPSAGTPGRPHTGAERADQRRQLSGDVAGGRRSGCQREYAAASSTFPLGGLLSISAEKWEAIISRRVLDDDHSAHKAGQDRRQGGSAWLVRHVPAYRGGDAAAAVRGYPATDCQLDRVSGVTSDPSQAANLEPMTMISLNARLRYRVPWMGGVIWEIPVSVSIVKQGE